MSGAEALVAIGVASNFIQLIDFTATLCSRIREYSIGSGTPKKLIAQADRLSDLLAVLKSLEQLSSQTPLNEQVLARCLTQAHDLSDLLETLKGNTGSRLGNARKAFKSLNKSEQIEELQQVLDGLVNTLSLQLQADARFTTKNIESSTITVLERQLEQTSLLNEIRRNATMKVSATTVTNSRNKTFWLVPIGRNAAFVGRYTIMNRLESSIMTVPDSVAIAVLCGLGGTGKSQIALEYVYRVKERTPDVSALWIYASNRARFVESYKRIASECEIPGRDDQGSDVLQLVRDWLESQYQCKFIMIIDNVDDRSMFFEESPLTGKAILEYVPQSSRGTIIYTTRSRDIGIDLAQDRDPIPVPAMEIEEARSLLGQRVKSQSTIEEQRELLEELVYLPLAISQATAFMQKRNKRVSEYMNMYRQSEMTRIRLLGQRFTYHGREARPLESVVTTWWISFQQIKEENSIAAELLAISSYMDNQSIPFQLLMRDDLDDFDFEEAMGLLEAYSLVTLDSVNHFCNVHRLVTVAVQAWLREYESDQHPSSWKALTAVCTKFPDGFFDTWVTCRVYLPHAESVLRHTSNEGNETVRGARAALLLVTSTYSRMQGQFQYSERAAVESINIFEELYGRENEGTLLSLANYAYTMHKLGRYHESLALNREVLAGREKLLGYDHSHTLESLNALGSDLQTLGLYKEAEVIHRRELQEKKILLDKDSGDKDSLEADYIIALNNVAGVLASQRQYAEGEKLHREALEKSQRILGARHPDTLITQGELAGTIRDQGRLAEAEDMYIKLLNLRIDVLGERHYDTLISLSNLALVKASQGNHEEGETMLRRCLDLHIETLGENHPSTIHDMHNLACFIFDKEDYEEAEALHRKCLTVQNGSLGSGHPLTLNTKRNIAESMRKQGKYDEADFEDRDTLKICEDLIENKETEMASTLEKIGNGLGRQNKYAEAEPIRRQELENRIAAGGEKDPRTIECLRCLAIALGSQGKMEEVIPIYQRILDWDSVVFGWDNDETLRTLWNLALAYRDTEQFELAADNYKKLLDIEFTLINSVGHHAVEPLIQLSWVLQQQKKYPESEKNYRKVLEILSEDAGSEEQHSVEPAMIMNNLASVLKYQDDLSEEAEDLLWKAYDARLERLGPEHPLSMKTLWFLASHLRDRGKTDEAYISFKTLRRLGHPDLHGGEQEDGRWSSEDEESEEDTAEEEEEQEHGDVAYAKSQAWRYTEDQEILEK